MMLLRANSLSKGCSGVRGVVIDTLCEMLNRGVHPVIPSQGSVGASGDLAPLAHQGLVLIGEGEAIYQGKRMTGAEAMRAAQIQPITLEAKETISLINGTQAMLAVGLLAVIEAEMLAETADAVGRSHPRRAQGTDAAFDERIHEARPHAGQVEVAANLRRLLAGSQIHESHIECAACRMPTRCAACRRCTAPYATPSLLPLRLRSRDELRGRQSTRLPGEEAGRPASGAPVQGDIISGGNFHGEPLAFALDFLAIALSALAGISERRIERLVNPALNEGLPAFLAPGAGLNSGFMMPQVTAAALVSENKVWAHPASVDSITTSGNKEDFVSMGMTAAIKLQRIVQNTRNVWPSKPSPLPRPSISSRP